MDQRRHEIWRYHAVVGRCVSPTWKTLHAAVSFNPLSPFFTPFLPPKPILCSTWYEQNTSLSFELHILFTRTKDLFHWLAWGQKSFLLFAAQTLFIQAIFVMEAL